MALMKIKTLQGEKLLGPGQPVFIMAEMSGNHRQSFERALQLIDAAAAAGVDAVKIQTYTPDTITLDSDKDYFQVKINDAWAGQTLYRLYQQAFTPWEWQAKLKEYAETKGLVFFSTPFDPTAVDFLETMAVEVYKVASFEVVDIPLLKKIGQTKKPVIMSRGLSSEEELILALKTLQAAGAPAVAILHCVSSYPAAPEEMNLATIPDLADKFKVVAGLSDHTLGLTVPIAAAALGASIIEKHFTWSRVEGGPDAGFSLEPEELKQMVAAVRETEKAIGRPNYRVAAKESENLIFRKSLFVSADIKKGEKFSAQNLRSIRPGHGLAPKYYEEILGRTAAADIERATPLSWPLVAAKGNFLAVRLVQPTDVQAIWEIRNHPVIRQYSSQTETIPLAQHLLWFENKYFSGVENDKKNHCFVLAAEDETEEGERVIGYCRFDFDSAQDGFIVSIAVAVDFQGQGLGQRLLSQALAEFLLPAEQMAAELKEKSEKNSEKKTVWAEIKKANAPSLKLFQKNGFVIVRENADHYYLKYEC